ncbi:mitochondrial fission factor-like isoform X3 [Trichomycterus rosablanca]|uniref:mitochondrial fission factor-like isoform X3 n=1 Tax=Trichomycterus rosablanca TaxID=2290929 RepID=UPI002F358B5C
MGLGNVTAPPGRLPRISVSTSYLTGCGLGMAAPVYLVEGSPARDPVFTAAISERMRVPERLGVAQGAVEDRMSRSEDLAPVYSMHVPDRLALIDAPDLSPRPLFSQRFASGHASSMWDLQHGPWNKGSYTQEPVHSPLRRSYSDQTFGRTPTGTPTHSNKTLHSSSVFGFPETPTSQPLKEHTGQTRKSAVQELWLSPEEESGTNVEFMVLRRQMMKMNRRIAGLERQNAERKQNELLLFSLLLSGFMINGWLWMRR